MQAISVIERDVTGCSSKLTSLRWLVCQRV